MREFGYDINKYMEYRKLTRYEAKNGKIEGVRDREEKYKGKELSDGAKRFIHDIERGLYDEKIKNI